MSEKKLLREWYGLEVKPGSLKENREQHGGKIILQGIIQRADAQNANRRIYPGHVLRREMENYMKAIRERRALGECDHPAERSTVNLADVSHLVTEAWWDGSNVMGKMEILPTPKGKIIESLIDAGVTLGVSSRGVGSTRKQGDYDLVEDDFQLICYDLVSEPSTMGAYLHEGRSIDLDPKKTWSKADRIYRALNDIVRK